MNQSIGKHGFDFQWKMIGCSHSAFTKAGQTEWKELLIEITELYWIEVYAVCLHICVLCTTVYAVGFFILDMLMLRNVSLKRCWIFQWIKQNEFSMTISSSKWWICTMKIHHQIHSSFSFNNYNIKWIPNTKQPNTEHNSNNLNMGLNCAVKTTQTAAIELLFGCAVGGVVVI